VPGIIGAAKKGSQAGRFSWRASGLQTQLLISSLLIICALTGANLLILRQTVRSQIASKCGEHGRVGPRVSKASRKVAGPIVKNRRVARRTSDAEGVDDVRDAPTIQDGSMPFWKLAGQRPVSPCRTRAGKSWTSCRESGIGRKRGRRSTGGILGGGEDSTWWFGRRRLYWVFLVPSPAGVGNNEKQLACGGWV